ncbi:MAG TPA: GNAT family N-acetyltransferase [Polyangiaceae bacterium]|nr:GNAT family N-acetyltransferase [Polyangiaceae bacterium]
MRRLTVLSIAYPFAPVSRDSPGGAEQILSILDQELVRAGHRSIVIAREDSNVHGELLALPREAEPLDANAVARAHATLMRQTAGVIEGERVDLTHLHGIDFADYLPPPGHPVLATLHLPPTWYPRAALAPTHPELELCCVSDAQHAAMPLWAADARVVPNGVRLDAFRARRRKSKFCLMLARICPEKGVHDALDAATEAEVPLWLAGEISSWPAHRSYFEQEVAPRLRGGHRYLGVVEGARKRRLLSAARAVLIPSRVPETSSLVAMEALASGTPVIAYRSGALPSVVDHEVTGFVVDDVQSLANGIRRAAELDPAVCRSAAESRFDARAMSAKYLSLYEELAPARPRSTSSPSGNELRLERVAGLRALELLAPDWSRLCQRVPGASPFQTPEWLLAYASTFCAEDGDAEPWALVARSREALVGVLPLCTRRTGNMVTTGLLGDGLSDYLDMVAERTLAIRCAESFFEELVSELGPNARLVFDQLRKDSPLRATRAPAGVREQVAERDVCPVVHFQTGLDPIPPNLRERIRYCRRRAERMGEVTIVAPRGSELTSWLETLFELHGSRWSLRGESGVLATEEVRRFQRLAVPALVDVDAARIFGMSIGAERAAALLVLTDRSAAYYYIGGFAPRFAALSPGTLLIAHVMDWARERGLLELDFLRGREPYKYRFGAHDRSSRSRTFEGSDAREAASGTLKAEAAPGTLASSGAEIRHSA